MDWLSIIFISVGLSMDSFAVSIANGLHEVNLSKIKVAKLALPLAIAQGIMPVIGWFLGVEIYNYIKSFDHWLAFLLLAMIGFKMVIDSFEKSIKSTKVDIKFHTVAIQSFATTIDALAVGFSLGLLGYSIIFPSIIIGIITLIFSIIGLYLGKRIGVKLGKKFEFLGGIILFLIGLRILIEHSFFNA